MGSAGLGEELRERTQLLQDIVLEVDEAAETRRANREESRQVEKELQVAGECICFQALANASSTATIRESGSADGDYESTPSRKRSQRHLGDSGREESRWIRSHLDSKGAADERRSNLEELQLEMDKQTHERHAVVEEKQPKLADRRISTKKKD